MYRLQGGGLRKANLQLQSESESLRNTGADSVSSRWNCRADVYPSSLKAGKPSVPAQPVRQDEFPLLRSFVLVMPSSDGMRPTSGRAICFTKFMDSNVSIIQKSSYRHTQNNVWLNVGICCHHQKLTQKIDHHKYVQHSISHWKCDANNVCSVLEKPVVQKRQPSM